METEFPTEEEDARAVVGEVAEATRRSLEALDFRVQPFGHRLEGALPRAFADDVGTLADRADEQLRLHGQMELDRASLVVGTDIFVACPHPEGVIK